MIDAASANPVRSCGCILNSRRRLHPQRIAPPPCTCGQDNGAIGILRLRRPGGACNSWAAAGRTAAGRRGTPGSRPRTPARPGGPRDRLCSFVESAPDHSWVGQPRVRGAQRSPPPPPPPTWPAASCALHSAVGGRSTRVPVYVLLPGRLLVLPGCSSASQLYGACCTALPPPPSLLALLGQLCSRLGVHCSNV